MDRDLGAFEAPIKSGKARILIKFEQGVCEFENSAPDFIAFNLDEVKLKIDLPNENPLKIAEFDKSYPVFLKEKKESNEEALFSFNEDGIWFDINIDQVKDIWVADLIFNLESKNSRYLAYYINEFDHQFEWLQPDLKTGEIKTMSISKKKYKVPKISGKEMFTSSEVIRCADMLNRAIHKIDLRIGGAYVKFNTDKGKLEPLITGIADKMGYKIEPLPKDLIIDLGINGNNVSHSIFLKKV